MPLSHAERGEDGWEEGAEVVTSATLAMPTVVGLGWAASEDIPCSLRVPAGAHQHWDRSFTLWDLLGAGRRWVNLSLGKVDEKLSTVTKENKPHSLAITLC